MQAASPRSWLELVVTIDYCLDRGHTTTRASQAQRGAASLHEAWPSKNFETDFFNGIAVLQSGAGADANSPNMSAFFAGLVGSKTPVLSPFAITATEA